VKISVIRGLKFDMWYNYGYIKFMVSIPELFKAAKTMKNSNFVLIYVFLILLTSCAAQPKVTSVFSFWHSKSITYSYKFKAPEQEVIVTFELSMISNGEMIVKSYDENKETQFAHYQKNGGILFTKYYKDGKLFLKSDYDYKNKKIVLSGSRKVIYNLKPDILEQNGGLPFILSRYLQPKGKIFKFKILQSSQNRLAEMNFKEVAREKISVLGKAVKTIKYELGLAGIVESKLWPYKYYYWYRESDKLFVKYTGINEKRQETTLILNAMK
jgi:hypothetical protein